MIQAHGSVALPYIIDVDDDQERIETSSKAVDNTVPLVLYELTEIREGRTKQHGGAQFSESKQGSNDWQQKLNLSVDYPKYR